MSPQSYLAMLSAAVIVVHFVCVCNRMGIHTSNEVRATYGMVGTSALAVALGPFYGAAPSWADAFAVLSIAVFMLLDRRSRL